MDRNELKIVVEAERGKDVQARRRIALAAKRAIDVLGAVFGLAACGIVYAWYARRIRQESPGPVFFSHMRTGLEGREFRCYKFRTMVVDAERLEAELSQRSKFGAAYFKLAKDPRVTPTGAWMRQRYLDELPQFWNVLRGEMSLVGPRPSTVRETAHYTDSQRRRLAMKPGMTGLFQVEGHDAVEDLDRLLAIDCAYIQHWSLWLDAKILFRTVTKLVRGDGL